MDHLASVTAPTLLIVGGRDAKVAELNREALARIPAEKRLEIIPGATHLFEYPGKLEEVTDLAEEWYRRYMITSPVPNKSSFPLFPPGGSGTLPRFSSQFVRTYPLRETHAR